MRFRQIQFRVRKQKNPTPETSPAKGGHGFASLDPEQLAKVTRAGGRSNSKKNSLGLTFPGTKYGIYGRNKP